MPEESKDQGSSCSSTLDFSGFDVVEGKKISESNVSPQNAIAPIEPAEETAARLKSETASSVAQLKADADISVARAEADTRVAKAEAKARVASARAEAEIEAANQIAKSKIAAEKSKRRAKTFGRIKRKITVRAALIGLAIVAALVVGGMFTWQLTKPPEFISSSQITNIVAVEKLSVVDFTYEGVAEYKGDGHDENPLHIHYKTKIKASFNPSKIEYDIDDEARTVTPTLPEINISKPNVDDRIDILEGDAKNIDMASVYNACEEDAAAEVKTKSNIKELAADNAQKAVEGLIKGLFDSKGYTLTWPKKASDSSKESEGGNNAA